MDCLYLSEVAPTDEAVLASPGAGLMTLTQGAYGSRGNLELAAPHPEGGSTVWWFNSDSPAGPVIEPAIPAASWSAGLHVPTGAGAALAIAQLRSGPLFLEIVSSGPDGLERWTWTPTSGFALTGSWAGARPGTAGLPYVVETDTDLVLGHTETVPERHGGEDGAGASYRVRRLRAPLARYPAMEPARDESIELPGEPAAITADAEGIVVVAVRDREELLLVRWCHDGSTATESTGVAPGAVVALATDPEVMLVAGPKEAEALACAWSVMDETLTLEIALRSGLAVTHRRHRHR